MNQRVPLSLRKLVRYTAVSAIATSVSLTILGTLVATGITTAGSANVIATALGTVPSFELNRRWVWGKGGRRSMAAEIGPFCVLSFSGLALSTIAVSTATGWATATGLGVGGRALAAEVANVGTFGSLWVAQYLILDRVLFRRRTGPGVDGGSSRMPDPSGAADADRAESDEMGRRAA